LLGFSLLGLLTAGRHVWLTLQPPSAVTTCSPTLEYMLQNLPLTETIKVFFVGSGDCGKVSYHLLGLNIPQWTLICFITIFVFSLVRYKVAKSEHGL
jgi:disulfide bond formation protein DsbB